MGLSQDTLNFIGGLLGIRQKEGPLKEEKFAFFSTGLPEATFGVVSFSGTESISNCFQFEVNLVSKRNGLDLDYLLGHEAVLYVNREDKHPVAFHGILNAFEQFHQAQGYTFYRATILPKLWYLNLINHNRVFLDKSLKQIMEQVLNDMLPVIMQYEFRLQGDYSQPLEYVCQYQENHFDFLSRWLEQQGLFYFFELTDEGDKLVITDSAMAHNDIPDEPVLQYREPSGLAGGWQEILTSFTCRSTPVARSVILKDYNYRNPSFNLTGRGTIHPNAQWDVHFYGDHFKTQKDADRLARVRSEELRCRQKTFHGKSSAPFLRPGFKFKLKGHYEKKFNGTYLITDVRHEGSQVGYLISGLKDELPDKANLFYKNTFTAIQIDVPFRPQRTTPKPRINGVINAKVDAEGSGEYAELDKWGRYKVVLPFDVSDSLDGHASAWLRMAQPFVGSNHGMHFPLRKGTEVLLTFIDGDPDRPIISSAIPNPDTPSVVSASNNTMSGIKTASGNLISFQDREGDRRITLSAAGGQSQIICSEGNSGNILRQSDHDLTSTIGSVGASTFKASLSALGQSLTANAWLGAAVSLLLKEYTTNLNKADQLGKFLDDIIPSQTGSNLVAASLILTPTVMNLAFKKFLTEAMIETLKKNKEYELTNQFGPRAKNALKEKQDSLSNWGQWLKEEFLAAKDITLGSNGSYGVLLFTNNEGSRWFNPKVGASLSLNPGNPDMLLATTKGFVDVMGMNGVRLFSSDKVTAHADTIKLQARKSVTLMGADSIVALDHGTMDLEAKRIRIGTPKNTSVEYFSIYSKNVFLGQTENNPLECFSATSNWVRFEAVNDKKYDSSQGASFMLKGNIIKLLSRENNGSLEAGATKVYLGLKDKTKRLELISDEAIITGKTSLKLNSQNVLNVKGKKVKIG